MQSSSGSVEIFSNFDNEKSPPKKINFNHERNCDNSSDNVIEMLHGNDRNSQSVLATTETESNSLTSSGNEVNLQKVGINR
jgi:hypothetical protein